MEDNKVIALESNSLKSGPPELTAETVSQKQFSKRLQMQLL